MPISIDPFLARAGGTDRLFVGGKKQEESSSKQKVAGVTASCLHCLDIRNERATLSLRVESSMEPCHAANSWRIFTPAVARYTGQRVKERRTSIYAGHRPNRHRIQPKYDIPFRTSRRRSNSIRESWKLVPWRVSTYRFFSKMTSKF